MSTGLLAAMTAPGFMQILPRLQDMAGQLDALVHPDAADLLTLPAPPPNTRQLLATVADRTGLPALILEGLGAVLTGFRPDFRSSHRAGLLGLPVSIQDPQELAELELGQRVAANVHAAAAFLQDQAAERAAGLPAALLLYLERGEPSPMTEAARRLEARRLASAVLGYAIVHGAAELAPPAADGDGPA